MYCRFCGNLINDKAVICVKSKNNPLLGRAYCQNCGAQTTQQQTVCTKCGMKLQAELSGVQKRLNYVTLKIESYKFWTKILCKFLILDLIVAVLSIVTFLLTMDKQDNIALGCLVVLLHVFISALVEGIIYPIFKSILKKYKKELTHIQGGLIKK